MTTVTGWTGAGKLISFYRHLAFNGPWVTTAVGVVLLLGIAAIRLYLLVAGAALPTYLVAYFAVLAAAAIVSAAAMIGRRIAVVAAGWMLGGLVSTASIAMYVVSRTVGLPGLPHLVAWWDYPLGTFAMAVAAAFLALNFAVLTGVSVARPAKRNWHD